jgi:hypothetical protein
VQLTVISTSPAVATGRADGRFVVFQSTSSNLVPFDGNASSDVFRYDRLTNSLTMVSTLADGSRTTPAVRPHHQTARSVPSAAMRSTSRCSRWSGADTSDSETIESGANWGKRSEVTQRHGVGATIERNDVLHPQQEDRRAGGARVCGPRTDRSIGREM